ncbi:hypothetical protein EVAR_78285_1 [Eumeta japonica]|uniref:Uncharacterized protein n=1 Tax=Eumeta variegata TaxID=151549 RepID=A0A4C1T432_EUMVA|nr:hypothetical protein EVAR_78285_1 [Eumeta japonica]
MQLASVQWVADAVHVAKTVLYEIIESYNVERKHNSNSEAANFRPILYKVEHTTERPERAIVVLEKYNTQGRGPVARAASVPVVISYRSTITNSSDTKLRMPRSLITTLTRAHGTSTATRPRSTETSKPAGYRQSRIVVQGVLVQPTENENHQISYSRQVSSQSLSSSALDSPNTLVLRPLGLSPDEYLAVLVSIYDVEAPSQTTIYRWYVSTYASFNEVVTLSAPYVTSRPQGAETPENVAAVQNYTRRPRHTTYALIRENVALFIHPVHSPVLSPNDFFTFPRMKYLLCGQRFEDPEAAVETYKSTILSTSTAGRNFCFNDCSAGRYEVGGRWPCASAPPLDDAAPIGETKAMAMTYNLIIASHHSRPPTEITKWVRLICRVHPHPTGAPVVYTHFRILYTRRATKANTEMDTSSPYGRNFVAFLSVPLSFNSRSTCVNILTSTQHFGGTDDAGRRMRAETPRRRPPPPAPNCPLLPTAAREFNKLDNRSGAGADPPYCY